jgi:micrococcal nuclease
MDEQPLLKIRRRRRSRGTAGALLGILILIILAINPEASTQPSTTPSPSASVSPTPTATTLGDAVLDAQPGLYRVTQVIDGDTIEVSIDNRLERVRLLGIDTPETHDPRKPVQCFGEVAAAYAEGMLDGKNVRLEPDPQNSDRDKYQRLLRYVYLSDGTLVNAQLIREGYAFAYTVFPLTRLDEFRELERQARTAGRGLWGGCNVDDSKAVKQTTGSR